MANKTVAALKKQVRKLEGLLKAMELHHSKTVGVIESALDEADAAITASEADPTVMPRSRAKPADKKAKSASKKVKPAIKKPARKMAKAIPVQED